MSSRSRGFDGSGVFLNGDARELNAGIDPELREGVAEMGADGVR